PAQSAADPPGIDAAGRRGAGDHHDRRDDRQPDDRARFAGRDAVRGGAPRGVRRLRSLEAGAHSRIVPAVRAPGGSVTVLVKILLGVAAVIVLAVGVLALIVAMRPAEFRIERSTTNTAEFTFKPEGDRTAVTWSMSGDNNFISRAVFLFVNMDKALGSEFEKGLASMKSAAEASAKS